MNTFNDIQFKQQIWAKQKGLTRETQFAGTEHETYLLANPIKISLCLYLKRTQIFSDKKS